MHIISRSVTSIYLLLSFVAFTIFHLLLFICFGRLLFESISSLCSTLAVIFLPTCLDFLLIRSHVIHLFNILFKLLTTGRQIYLNILSLFCCHQQSPTACLLPQLDALLGLFLLWAFLLRRGNLLLNAILIKLKCFCSICVRGWGHIIRCFVDLIFLLFCIITAKCTRAL